MTQEDSGRRSQVGRRAVSEGARLQGSEECVRDEDVVGHDIEGGKMHDSPARRGDMPSMSIETETTNEKHRTQDPTRRSLALEFPCLRRGRTLWRRTSNAER